MSDRSELAAEREALTTEEYVLRRYQSALDYYWKTSRYNKRAYKTSRYLTVILGAVVTLMASLSSANLIQGSPFWAPLFAIATPILAALLAMVGGITQSFQWDAAWQEMVLAAERLEKEYDRLRVTSADARDPAAELDRLNDLVLAESRNFFERILGRGKPPGAEVEQTSVSRG